MLAYAFVLIAIAARFLPHAGSFNFTPVAAALLFFGARMPRKQAWIPVALFVAADIAISHFVYGYAVQATQIVVWGWYAAVVLMASMLKTNASPRRLLAGSLAASVTFFVVSNFAVWAEWTMYPRTLAGLTECYTMAIPFFRNTVASDLLFTCAFFGVAALLPRFSHQAQPTA